MFKIRVAPPALTDQARAPCSLLLCAPLSLFARIKISPFRQSLSILRVHRPEAGRPRRHAAHRRKHGVSLGTPYVEVDLLPAHPRRPQGAQGHAGGVGDTVVSATVAATDGNERDIGSVTRVEIHEERVDFPEKQMYHSFFFF